jgi:mRNA interferase MazF
VKEFDKWNELKKNIHATNSVRSFKERDIFHTKLGSNIGFEQDGKGNHFIRPVVIIKKFSKDTFLGIPLSTTSNRGSYYFEFSFTDKCLSVALLTQIRLFDAKRLLNKVGIMEKEDHEKLKKAIKNLL